MIIGLVGFKQVGKSTAAKHLEGRGFKRHNFKDALVKEMKENLHETLDQMVFDHLHWEGMKSIDDLFQLKPPLMRALMQNYGTDVRRKDNDNYWVDQWAKNSYGMDHIVVDDVRFINEAEKVRERGGIIVRLTRPDIETGGTHASETEQLEIVADHTIDCEPGNHAKLYQALDEIILPPENWAPKQ